MKGFGRQICRSRVRRVIGGEKNFDQFVRELKRAEEDGCVTCLPVVCSFLGVPSNINSLEILKTQLNAMGRQQKKSKKIEKNQKTNLAALRAAGSPRIRQKGLLSRGGTPRTLK